MTSDAQAVDHERWSEHFDPYSPELANNLHTILEQLRANTPFPHSDQHEGFWVATTYEDVLRVAQDWSTFSSQHGITVPGVETDTPAIPEQIDPPLHREYKRLINAWFTPAAVAKYEQATRDLVTRLIDDFIESGSCDFMEAFARPLPGMVFFEMVLHAPPEELDEVNRLSTLASTPTDPASGQAMVDLLAWIDEFVDRRRAAPAEDDVINAILNAEIEGRPIRHDEVIGMIQLLLFGGLDTTSGALGMMMLRFCQEPEIPELLRTRPELFTDALEELLRLDNPFICIARTAMTDTEVGGQQVKAGDKVLISWASANRDEKEFGCPMKFDAERPRNRHLAFGAGPHRCAGSNLARLNLRISIHELVHRLQDLRLATDEEIQYNSHFSRSPVSVPIAFTPGTRLGAS